MNLQPHATALAAVLSGTLAMVAAAAPVSGAVPAPLSRGPRLCDCLAVALGAPG